MSNSPSRPSPVLFAATGSMVLALLVLAVGATFGPAATSPGDRTDRTLAEAVVEHVDRLLPVVDAPPTVSTPRSMDPAAPLAAVPVAAALPPNAEVAARPMFGRIRDLVSLPRQLPSLREWGAVADRVAVPPPPREVLTAAAFSARAASEATTLDLYRVPGEVDARGPADRFATLRDNIRALQQPKTQRLHQRTTRPVGPPATSGPFWEWTREELTRLALADGADCTGTPRPDLSGLPLLEGNDCIQPMKEAAALKQVSGSVGRRAAQTNAALAQMERTGRIPDEHLARVRQAMSDQVHRQVDLHGHRDPSGLHQILQVAPLRTRLYLVKTLAEDSGPEATKALVQRTLFDPDEAVRDAATRALAERPHETHDAELLAAFEYPWPPVADHATEALVKLEKTHLLDNLRAIADENDPRAPFTATDGMTYAREMVRVNHLRNCLLCHAPRLEQTSATARVQASGVVPDPYAPLPNVYYSGRGDLVEVRADVTYLWQDFSLVQDVANPQKGWPDQQRFDYFVRTRRVSTTEAADLARQFPRRWSPQRRAVRDAISQLETIVRNEARLAAKQARVPTEVRTR